MSAAVHESPGQEKPAMNGAEDMGHDCIQTGNIRFSVDNGMEICYNVAEIIGSGKVREGKERQQHVVFAV